MITLVSFLDEKNENLQDVRCNFNLISEKLEIIITNIKELNIFKDIIQMLHNRHNMNLQECKISLKMLDSYGIINNELNLLCMYNGVDIVYYDITTIKYEII